MLNLASRVLGIEPANLPSSAQAQTRFVARTVVEGEEATEPRAKEGSGGQAEGFDDNDVCTDPYWLPEPIDWGALVPEGRPLELVDPLQYAMRSTPPALAALATSYGAAYLGIPSPQRNVLILYSILVGSAITVDHLGGLLPDEFDFPAQVVALAAIVGLKRTAFNYGRKSSDLSKLRSALSLAEVRNIPSAHIAEFSAKRLSQVRSIFRGLTLAGMVGFAAMSGVQVLHTIYSNEED